MSLFYFLIENPLHVVTSTITGVICLVIYRIISFYSNRKNYPPGPFPLPFVGNVLLFRQKGRHIHHILQDVGQQYGKVFTFFLGSDPQVFVSDPQLALEVMKKHQYAGRPHFEIFDQFFKEGSTDVVFSDFNKEWEVLRKVSHSALRKYAVSDKLPQVVSRVVDEVLVNIKKTASQGEAIDLKFWLFKTLYAILMESAFGHRYTFDNPDLNKWIDNLERQQQLNSIFILLNFLPWLKYFYRKERNELTSNITFQQDFMEKEYNAHLKKFDGVTIGDFTDAMLMAKKEAEEEDLQEALKYLKPWNIMNSIQDLFTAGSETSRSTLLWAFLLMVSYPDYQRRLRKEIEEHVPGDQIPTLEHRKKCHFTASFIAETLRFRHIVPSNVPHKTTVDIDLGGHIIKEGTTIIPMLSPLLSDKDVWQDPDVFRPERFFDADGKFISKPNQYYVPFSGGRRTCPGEKVALADMFFIIARILQQTKGFEFVLPGGPGSVDLYGDPDQTGGWLTYNYQVFLKPVNGVNNL